MSRPSPKRIVPKLLILAGAAVALAACGKVGELDRPGPMWGEKAKADWAAQQKAAADAQSRKDDADAAQRGHPPPVSPDSAPSNGPSSPQQPQ
jgi:hypothetical protein